MSNKLRKSLQEKQVVEGKYNYKDKNIDDADTNSYRYE